MSTHRSAKTWAVATTIVLVGLLIATAVVLTSRQVTGLEGQRRARAVMANAVVPAAAALRTAMSADAAGPTPGSRQVTLAEAGSAGISSATAIRARDSGQPMLDDSGKGMVVAAVYDTPTAPASVTERRSHVIGLRLAPLDLTTTLEGVRPTHGGISLAGPDRTVLSLGRTGAGHPSYSVALAPDPAPDWTLTVWTSTPPLPTLTWVAAFLFVLAGVGAAVVFVRRDDGARRDREELWRLQQTSTTTAALATVAQHSLDLADLLPTLTVELADALGLQGLSVSTPSADGDRLSFAWGREPADVAPSAGLPVELKADESLCLNLLRGGRTAARLRVVAGRTLDRHDVEALGAASEILTSALANAEAFSQQRDLVQRMRAVDELKTVFLATASHELRTPVGAISGYASLLASGWESLSPAEGQLYAERVENNARRLGALVDDLLDYSRLERGDGVMTDGSALDLGEAVAGILDERPELSPDHQLVHETGAGIEVIGTRQAVERVLLNLVGNAQKYSPAGTTIRVSVTQKHGRAELAVDDQGPGVPAAERDQIFSRFFRGQGDAVVATRGVGLGLAIVSEFAGSMAGEISVTESESGGARFVVSYPLAVSTQLHSEGATNVGA